MTDRDITKDFGPVARVHQVPMEPLFEAAFKNVGPLYIVQPRGAIRSYGFLIRSEGYASPDARIRSPSGEVFGGLRMYLGDLSSFQRVRHYNVLAQLCKRVGVKYLIDDNGYDLRIRGILVLEFHKWDRTYSDVAHHWSKSNPNISFEHAFELVR